MNERLPDDDLDEDLERFIDVWGMNRREQTRCAVIVLICGVLVLAFLVCLDFLRHK
jgi:hypothetical protein